MEQIFYATDRQLAPSPGMIFGHQRTNPPGLRMGWEEVRIGPDHQLGKIDPAIEISAMNEKANSTTRPGMATPLQRSDAEMADVVGTEIRGAIRNAAATAKGRPRVLLYVHGYRTTFATAVRNTAQLAADLDLITCAGRSRGVAVTYSWPAQNTLFSYLADEENAEWTQQRLAPFVRTLARVCREQGAELTLIAHSMGARALVRSLADLANTCEQEGRSEQLADHLVLLAPDIGKGLFDQYVERFLPLVHHLTIYVSSKDRALGLSTFLHGGHHRLGLIESTLLAALEITGLHREDHRELGYIAETQGGGKVDMIDVTESFAAQFGHSYEDPLFIRDLRALIYHDTPAGVGERSNLERRTVRPGLFRNVGTLSYYQLRKP